MIVVNFKTYKEATGYRAIELARICKKIQDETKVRVVVVPQLADLRDCVETGVDCWVQHIDAVDQGKNTGYVTRESVEEVGAKGTLLNHSEHKVTDEALTQILKETETLAFETCVCAADATEAQKWNAFKPNFILYEPPELVGSPDKSVSTEKPEIIDAVVKAVTQPVLVGAGVKNIEDVKVAVKLGAKGVGLASGFVLATDPESMLRELVSTFNRS